MRKKGFTLIEVIAVIAILSVLAVIAVPRVIQYVDKSKKVAIQTEAKNLYDAAERAHNEGIIIPEDGSVQGDTEKKNIIFDNMNLFQNDCNNGAKSVITILEEKNYISKEEGKKAEKKLSNAYYIGLLKQVINADTNKIVLDKNGCLNNWSGIPIKDENTKQQNNN